MPGAGDAGRGVERELAFFGDRGAEPRRAEQLQREPDAQPGKAARQIRAVLARIVEISPGAA